MTEMLRSDLVSRFMEQISHLTNYNVNIISTSGKIIASSRSPERIGDFHEGAYRMLQENREEMCLEGSDSYLGSKYGVNLLIRWDSQPVGVIGVTGSPQEVREIAAVIKMALETMLSYEGKQQEALLLRSVYEQFYFSLLSEKKPDQEKLERLAGQLGFDSKCIRLPILLYLSGDDKPERVQKLLAQGFLKQEDMSWIPDEQHILVFKRLSGHSSRVIGSWRSMAESFLEELRALTAYRQATVGSMQSRLSYYRTGFRHCHWLEGCRYPERNVFFADHVAAYLEAQIPEPELYAVYNVYERCMEEGLRRSVVETVGVLRDHNYRMEASSQALFVHKNTLALRMGKIKDAFGLNPFQSGRDRDFLEYMYLYLKRKNP